MANKDIAMEQTPQGELINMPLVGGERGRDEARHIARLVVWNDQARLGEVFSSSTVFKLPNGDRSPDAAWVAQEPWEALTQDQQKKFPPLCPDFVIECDPRAIG